MDPLDNFGNVPEWVKLVRLDPKKIRMIFPENPDHWVLVDTAEQCLTLHLQQGKSVAWPVSTGAVGINGKIDSNGTPPGLHIIKEKIGKDEPAGMVFLSRQPTGNIWKPESGVAGGSDVPSETDPDLILTRILTLEGLEKGLNRGPGCDSLERYIYIHGTNHETEIGHPVSHGCVRMTGAHVTELFDLVAEGDPVVIL
ncbi:MAG: L,D-transpeptidase [Gemmatimonadales bacterium]|nr:L,D-transpeptidase [Gemmatimonadales bacterium]